MATAPVLIIGAGPTGLCLALSLARRGAPLRIISDAKGPGERSRAMAVHARTLEFYSQFGFADEVIAEGLKAERVQVRDDGREVASFSLKEFGQGLSPYPFLLTYPQDDHERFLVSKLKEAGCEIQWNTKLMGFREGAEGVCATIAHEDGRIENSRAAYICGCDGAHSCVRETLGLSFAGRTYEQLFYVADVKISGGFDRQLYANLGAHALGLMFPVRSSGMQRLIGLVPSELSARSDLKFDDIRGQLEPLLKVKVVEVNWFSTYRVHHRVAERFRLGRAFLLGDAGHIHSPAGGQGMNTGIGDAINLGWKLAQVLQGRAPDSLLASYEEERIGFARALVATTDRAFTPIVAKGPWGEFTRRAAAPLLLRVATGFRFTRRMMFRMISQIHIHYRQSALSEGKAGKVRGGDRLAWMPATPDNYAPLRSLDWQMHVYGSADEGFTQACREIGLPVHAFAWDQEATSSGFRRGAAYLVRPDGYVALATEDQSISRLTSFADRNGLRFGVLGRH